MLIAISLDKRGRDRSGSGGSLSDVGQCTPDRLRCDPTPFDAAAGIACASKPRPKPLPDFPARRRVSHAWLSTVSRNGFATVTQQLFPICAERYWINVPCPQARCSAATAVPCYSLTQRPTTSEQAPVAGRWSPLVTRAQSRDFLCPCTLAASAASAATRSQRRRVMSVCAGSAGFQ